MQLARGAALLAALADVGFGLLFLIRPDALAEDGIHTLHFVYARWVAACLFASAALLGLAAREPERFLPVYYVNIGARILVVAVSLLHLARHFVAVMVVLPSQGALAAVMIAALVYDARAAQKRTGA